MGVTRHVMQYGQRRIARKMMRSLPWLGSLVALATLGMAIRRKGAWRGTMDTALDFIPYVGGVKNAAEVLRGRDFFPDKPAVQRYRRSVSDAGARPLKDGSAFEVSSEE